MTYIYRGSVPDGPRILKWRNDQEYREKMMLLFREANGKPWTPERKRSFAAMRELNPPRCCICQEPGHSHNQCPTLVTVRII